MLRFSLVATEWATEHLQAWNAVFAEGRKRNNVAYFGPALIEMEIADADKRAEWSFRVCCEIWAIQGHPKSRLFFRAVFGSCLEPIFSGRENAFTSELEQLELRTGQRLPQGMQVITGSLRQSMQRLRMKWNTKIEIAIRDNNYEQQRTQRETLPQKATPPSPIPVDAAAYTWQGASQTAGGNLHPSVGSLSPKQVRAAALSFEWRELESRFGQLQAKPDVSERVTADFTRTEWESGSVTEGWTMQGNPVYEVEFERFAAIAARKLGYSEIDDAIGYWLERVREWLRRTGLDKDKSLVSRPTGEGHERGHFFRTTHLVTGRIAELSAMYCIELLARGVPECSVLPPAEEIGSAGIQSQPRRSSSLPKRTPKQLRKAGVIFGAIQSGLKSLKYCAALDERKIHPPDEWIDDGCPPTYAQAYRVQRWRKRIQDEKFRHRKEHDSTTAREREALIQAATNTRLTRR